MAKKRKQGGLKGIKRHTPLGEAAARTIAVQLDEFEERSAALRALADSDDAPSADQLRELHELRIAAKRLRYTLEIFQPILPGGAADAIDDLKHLQDELGFVHDRDVLTDLALEDRRFTAERELAQLSGVAERSGRTPACSPAPPRTPARPRSTPPPPRPRSYDSIRSWKVSSIPQGRTSLSLIHHYSRGCTRTM